MRVSRVAEIGINGEIIFSARGRSKARDVVIALTNASAVEDPNADFTWKVGIALKTGQVVQLDLPHLIGMSDSPENPLFIANEKLVFFRDRLFMPERAPKDNAEREEILLRVKKDVYVEEAELASLRSTVANLEAAIEYSRSGPKRDAIPEDVKLVVWTRDGGACVRCGSKETLHFDHVIPVAKGGGTSESNIQILCQTCNLKKSDKIATM